MGRAWRYDLLRELRAWCLRNTGDLASALEETRLLLDRYERQPRLAELQPFPHLEDLAAADPDGECAARARRLIASAETSD